MRRMAIVFCCGLLVLGSALRGWAGQPGVVAASPMPPYRIEAEGFEAREADIRAVLDSAGGELWRFFPGTKIEPILVSRGHQGPITLYKRNDRHEIVVHLDTGKTFWSQYAYQFAHEFCHILCGYKQAYEGNKWFEETVCETASVFVMRAMARSWRTAPPYPNWKDYHDSLRDYADDVLRGRDKACEIFGRGLPEFYRAHKAALEKEPGSRELNGAMSIVLLHLLEERPQRWEAVRWLNASTPRDGDTLAAYFQKWHDAAPARHQPFVERIAESFGVSIPGR